MKLHDSIKSKDGDFISINELLYRCYIMLYDKSKRNLSILEIENVLRKYFTKDKLSFFMYEGLNNIIEFSYYKKYPENYIKMRRYIISHIKDFTIDIESIIYLCGIYKIII